MNSVQFVQHTAAFTAGYIGAKALIWLAVYAYKKASHWWYHYRTGKPHLTNEERNRALAQFYLAYDPSAEDPEVNSQSYEFCRKCKMIKKNFVGEGRKKLCMDCAFGDGEIDTP